MKQKTSFKKLTSVILTFALVIGLVPLGVFTAYAAGFTNEPLGGNVVANYNGTDLLTISGHGQIERDKWIAMAKKIYHDNYPNDNRGWIGTETFHIVLNSTAADNQIKLPDDSSFLFGEFYQVIDFGTNNVDTTKVTDMRAMFYRATNFNGDISDWNTAKVTDMRAMFSDATSFNGDISGWNTANVTDMGYMFYNATGYRQPIELDISGLKDDQYTTGKEGLANAFNGCPAPSIILNAGDNKNIDATDAFVGTSLSYLEFSGLIGAKIDGFSGNYVVEDVAAASAVDKDLDETYEFADNKHYKVYLQSAKDIKACAIASISPQLHSGSSVEPDVTIIDTLPDPDYKLIKDKDYTLTYKDNINIGTATVTITGIGNYCSDTTKQFEITDKKVPILAANDLTKNYDGKVITLSDITGKSAKDGSADVAGTWHFVDGGSLVDTLDITAPGTSTLTLKFVPDDTTSYSEATLNIALTIHSPLAYNGAGFKLHADSDATSDVVAQFTDATETKLAISGHGQIDRAKWKQMAQLIDAANYPNYDNGWVGTEAFDIEFQSTAADNQIKLPVDSRILFDQFDKAIDFGVNNVNTANVETMLYMFYGVKGAISGALNDWNVSNVTDMGAMFSGASSFNQPIGSWDVSSVVNMRLMFNGASSFNQPIGGWDVSKVADMRAMFRYASSYKQPIELDISAVKYGLSEAFKSCTQIPSIILNNPKNTTNIDATDAFAGTALSYLEFSGLNNAEITGFSGKYIVQNVTDAPTVEEQKNQTDSYTFDNNKHYKVYLQSAKDIKACDIAPIPDQAHTGSPIEPTLEIKDNVSGVVLEEGSGKDYTLSYADNVDIGVAKITIKGEGAYTSTRTLYFKIKEPTPLAYNGAGFKLHADSDATSDVIAQFTDATETKLAISGHGQIDRDKWKQMAKQIDTANYLNEHRGWVGVETFDIEFQSTAADNQIKLPVDSTALFRAFNGDIDFGANNVNTEGVTNMYYMFREVTGAVCGALNDWNVSHVTDMCCMFAYATNFDGDISAWNTSSVTDMRWMFYDATDFNRDISKWDTANVTGMLSMFKGATNFNGDISAWDTAKVTDMAAMFDGATNFNGDISAWNTAKVTDMRFMFRYASSYKQPIELDISGLKDDVTTTWIEGLGRAFENCAAPSIILNNPKNNKNIDATDAFVGTSLSYLEFSGLTSAKIDGFSGDYIVENRTANTTTRCAFNVPYNFDNNAHYIVYTAGNATLSLSDITKTYQFGTTATENIDIAALLPADAGAITTTLGAISGDAGILAGGADAPKVSGNVLTYKLSGTGSAGATATLPLTVSSVNYQDVSFNVVIKLVELVKKQLSDCTIKPLPNQIYTGSAIKPSLKITDGNYQLIKDIDYTVVYADNTAIGTAKVTVTGKGNYEGEAVKFFNIVAATPSQGGGDDDDDDRQSGKDVIVIKNPTSEATTTKPSTPPSSSAKPSQTAKAFVDVKQSDWFSQAVDYVVQKGLMNGTGNNAFSPQLTTSRAMLATMLYRLAGQPAVSDSMTFNDVASGKWYSNAIMWSQSKAIVKGYQDGSFKPNDNLTREQLVTMLYRYAKAMQYDVSAKANLSRFVDSANVSPYALGAMQWAVESGIISGTTATTLDPQGHATRAQVAMMMMRFSKAYVK